MQRSQKLDKCFMSETLLAISAKEELHQATIFYRTANSYSSSKSIAMKSPLSIVSSHQIHDVLEFISFYLSIRDNNKQLGYSYALRK